PEGDFRKFLPRFRGDSFEKNIALVDRVGSLAEAKGCTPGQLALAWVLSRGDDVVPIPGTKRRTYLAENVAALEVELTASDLAAIEEVFPAGAVSGDRYPDMSGIAPTSPTR
ncbi:MAG: aldo/keto reductase, partial [Acidimicrobiales bacterium]